MSTTAPSPRLCERLVDDAAVFPPAQSPVDRAWRAHVERRDTLWDAWVGPLLLAPVHADLLATVARSHPVHQSVSAVLVARPGVPSAEVDEAMAALEHVPSVRLVGVETGHGARWLDGLAWQLPLAVELGREPDEQRTALEELAQARADGHPVMAKLRTQTTASHPLPSADELAGVLVEATRRGVPLKLTGGLHHAVAGDHCLPDGSTEWQHGVANVLAAAHTVHAGGDERSVAAVLRREDGPQLSAGLRSLTDDQVEALRHIFPSFGCCTVLDPLRELAALGLLDPDPDPDEETV
jgi:hypothetical protein